MAFFSFYLDDISLLRALGPHVCFSMAFIAHCSMQMTAIALEDRIQGVASQESRSPLCFDTNSMTGLVVMAWHHIDASPPLAAKAATSSSPCNALHEVAFGMYLRLYTLHIYLL
eukprot:scaffold667_cov103-Skeletonema_dohrnii-CCMP3373.AAC.6